MPRIFITFIIVVFALCGEALAQRRANVAFANASLDSLMAANARTNRNQTMLDGYRIQIYSGSGVSARKEAEAARQKFLQLFPDEKALVIYNAPFWRVRIGDYRFRTEALVLLERVKLHFPGSYAVRDNTIRKREFWNK